MRKYLTILTTLLLFFTQIISSSVPALADRAQPQVEPPIKMFLPLVRKDEPPAWVGPDGGYIPALVISPQNPSVIYAGSWGAGVFKSTDGGNSWVACSNGLGNLFINSLAVNPTNHNEVYAGTYRGKLYKSTNGCASWSWSSSGIQEQAIVYSIVVDPKAPRNVYIATRGTSNNGFKPWNGVVYASRDSGASWFPSLINLGGVDFQDWIYALGIDPVNPTRIFGASHEHGFYISLNSGYYGTWTDRKEGLDDWSGRAVLVNPISPEILYYGSWHYGQVAKSTNTALSWLPSSTGMAGVKVYGMGLAASDPDTLYVAAASDGIYKSSDGGDTWGSAGLNSLRHYTVQVNPQNPSEVLVGTIGDGVYKSTNGGSTWARSSRGLHNSSISGWAVSPDNPDMYYAGVNGSGVWTSPDRGMTWNKYDTNLVDEYVNRLVQRIDDPNILYALTGSAGVYKRNIKTDSAWTTLNAGLPSTSLLQVMSSPLSTWDPVDDPMLVPSTAGINSPQASMVPLVELAMGGSNPQTMYIGTELNGLYRSQNAGAWWEYGGRTGETIWAIAVDPQDPAHVYSASDKVGGLDVTSNSGNAWVDGGLPDRLVYSLAYSPANLQVLFAGTDNGVYSQQAGTWQQMGLAGLTVTSVAVNPGLSQMICAGTYQGAYCSTNSGATWFLLTATFSGAQIRSIYFDPFTGKNMYFNTQEMGTLRYPFIP